MNYLKWAVKSWIVVGALAWGSCGSGTPAVTIVSGQYDGTFSPNGSLVSASFIVGPNIMSMSIVDPYEGTTVSSTCTRVQSRFQVNLSLQGDSGSGSISQVRKYQGSCFSSDYTSVLRTLAVKRTAGTGTSFANFDGSWTLTTNQADVAHLTVTGTTYTGDYMATPTSTPLHFSGSLTDPVLSMTSDSGVELAAARH